MTKHLHVLANAGVARGRQHGRERIWEFEPETLRGARAYLERVSAQWDVGLSRLQRFVELEGTYIPTETKQHHGPGAEGS